MQEEQVVSKRCRPERLKVQTLNPELFAGGPRPPGRSMFNSISSCGGLPRTVPPTSCQKRPVFPRSHTKNLSAPWPSRFSNFWACGRCFSSFWLCAPSFPFILAFWAFILASRPPFWPFGVHFATLGLEAGHPLALCVLLGLQGGILLLFAAFCAFRGVSFTTSSLRPWGGSRKLPKTVGCPKVPYKEFISAVAESIFQFLGLWALIFFILALYAFISFHFGLLGLHFSFSASILAFGASILPLRALRGGILWLFVSFWAFRGHPFALCGFLSLQGGILHNFWWSAAGPPPHKLPKIARLPNVLTMDLSAP